MLNIVFNPPLCTVSPFLFFLSPWDHIPLQQVSTRWSILYSEAKHWTIKFIWMKTQEFYHRALLLLLTLLLPMLSMALTVTVASPATISLRTVAHWTRSQEDPLDWNFHLATNTTDFGFIVAHVESQGEASGSTDFDPGKTEGKVAFEPWPITCIDALSRTFLLVALEFR